MPAIKAEDRTAMIGLGDYVKMRVGVGDHVWTYDGRFVKIVAISASGQIAYDHKVRGSGASRTVVPDYAGTGFTTDPRQCIEAQERRIVSAREDVKRMEDRVKQQEAKLATMRTIIDAVAAGAKVICLACKSDADFDSNELGSGYVCDCADPAHAAFYSIEHDMRVDQHGEPDPRVYSSWLISGMRARLGLPPEGVKIAPLSDTQGVHDAISEAVGNGS